MHFNKRLNQFNKYLLLILLITNFNQLSYSQTVSDIKNKKEQILKKVKANKANKQRLKKSLEFFDLTFLKAFLQDYGLPNKSDDKSKLINTIIDNIPIISKDIKYTDLTPYRKKDKKDEAKKQKTKKTDMPVRLVYSTKRYAKIGKKANINTSNVLLYNASSIFASDKKDKKGFRRILLFANVKLVFRNKTITADAISIKIDEGDNPIEVVAAGSLLIKDNKNNRIVADKIYYFPQIKRGLLVNAKVYNRPFVVKGKKTKQVANSKYIIEDGYMSSCNIVHPHYSINFSRAWHYDGDRIWATNVEYKVGGVTLFYTPIFFHTKESTGIKTAFGYEKGISWFLHNTFEYKPRSSNYSMKVKADYYQKLGVYLGYEFTYSKGGHRFLFDSAIALDRSIKYIGGEELFTNFFDQDGDGKPEETNNFRWRVKLEGNLNLFSSPKGFNSNLSMVFKSQAEPFFQSQFESSRKFDFTLWDLTGTDKSDRRYEGATSSFSSASGQQLNFKLVNSYKRLYITTSGDFNYRLQRDNTNLNDPPKNPYKASSYKNYKHLFTFPKIDSKYSNTIQLVGSDKPELESEKKKREEKEKQKEKEYLKEYETNGKYSPAEEKKESQYTKQELDKYLPPVVKRLNKLRINLPMIYSLSFSLSEKKTYNTALSNNDIQSDTYNGSSVFNLRTPFTLTYRFMTFDIALDGSVGYNLKKTKNADALQKTSDNALTYGRWDVNVSGSLNFNFFEEYEYLNLTFGLSSTYRKSGRFDKIKKENGKFINESGRSESYSASANMTFLKTEFSVSFSDSLYISASDQERINNGTTAKSEVLKQQKGNLSFSVTSTPFSFLSVSNSYSYSRREEKSLTNNFSVSVNLVDKYHLFGPIYLNSLSYTVAWFNDFKNERGNSLSSSFKIDFSITKNWNFIYKAISSNRQLYRYSSSMSKKYGKESRNFFIDLIDSFNFFDKSKRERSFFNLDSMSFKIRHDLHDWMMEFELNLSVKQFRSGPFYFEPSFYLTIYLKELPSFKYPKISDSLTKE